MEALQCQMQLRWTAQLRRACRACKTRVIHIDDECVKSYILKFANQLVRQMAELGFHLLRCSLIMHMHDCEHHGRR